MVYENDFKYKIIALYCDGKTSIDLENEYDVSNSTIMKWFHTFVLKGAFNKNELNLEENKRLENLRERAAIYHRDKITSKNIYDNEFKYKMITLLCDGKTPTDLYRKYGIARQTVTNWLRSFIAKDFFYEEELSQDERIKLKKLRERAVYRDLELRPLGQTKDVTLKWVLEFDTNMEEWRALAEKWLKTKIRSKESYLRGLTIFLGKYIIALDITRIPKDFLKKEYAAPNFYKVCFEHLGGNKHALHLAKNIILFIDWLLLEKFSVEDELGKKQILYEFHNPLSKYLPEISPKSFLNESDKNVLPYRYIKEIRSLLCPPDATFFKDWKFAQEATDPKGSGGDWFVVNESLIDRNDFDCVYRKRKTSKYERKQKGLSNIVYELWSPATSVALLIKLLLPLRTYQVRMLDSGERDTYKYIQESRTIAGSWIKNKSSLNKGNKNNPFQKGVLRKFNDSTSKMIMTGFYINTNKTADINKEEDHKGYEIPWQYEEVQYWIAKLRDWQSKYNPVNKSTPWLELKRKHIGFVKDEKILKDMGSTTFIFRNPTTLGEENLPITKSGLNPLWYKVLSKLENNILLNGSQEEKSIRFIKNSKTTFYPLHSLRVSLITAYALEGGVPMPILSKAIAGHARLAMTLYYTKAGISYVTDKMNQAEHNILKNDKESFGRFLRDAKYEHLETNIVTNDPIAFQTVVNARQSGAGIIIGDKGICPKGNFGCDCGGVFINDDTGKITIGSVPGYPEQNCVRCRWFVTGPAFLPGLVHHFNTIGYNMGETGKKVLYYQREIEKLENHKYECQLKEQIFTDQSKLLKFEKLNMQEIQKNDKLANDYNATLRLIDKCKALIRNNTSKEFVQLIPVGSIDDVGLIIKPVEHELEQIQVLCNGAEIFPETDASKAILQRSQIIDLTLARNDMKPVMFSLTEEEQLTAGNQFMRLLMNRAGSLKNAVPYAVGRKKLEEIGLENEFVEEIESVKFNGLFLPSIETENKK